MFNTFALIVMLTLPNNQLYVPNVVHYDNFATCMNTAMNITYSYRRSDLKDYTVKCLKVIPEEVTDDN